MAELRVHLLPVGRGDCLLVRLPDCSWAVVDCGQKRGHYEPYNQAAAFLNNENPKDSPIRFILATHPHADHDGGILQFMQLLGRARPVHAVYFCGVERRAAQASTDARCDDGAFSFIEEAKQRVSAGEIRECRPLRAGETIALVPPIEGVRIDVLWPDSSFIQKAEGLDVTQMDNELVNNLSVVLRLDFGGRSTLLLGDLHGAVCDAAVRQGIAGSSPCIIKAPHHGAKESVIPWVSCVCPKGSVGYVLISSPTGDEKHPHMDFLRAIPPQDWKIRCTGLAKACRDHQSPETWPPRQTRSFLPESLWRSLFSLSSRRRFPLVEENEECCLDNQVTLREDGSFDHTRASRSCDAPGRFQ